MILISTDFCIAFSSLLHHFHMVKRVQNLRPVQIASSTPSKMSMESNEEANQAQSLLHDSMRSQIKGIGIEIIQLPWKFMSKRDQLSNPCLSGILTFGHSKIKLKPLQLTGDVQIIRNATMVGRSADACYAPL